MAAGESKTTKPGDPFGLATMLPIVLGIVALGVGGLFSAFTGTILGIVVGIVAAAVLWALPFLTGRVTVDDFRHSPETILMGSDDRLSSPPEGRKYQYLIDGELKDRPIETGQAASPLGEADPEGEAAESRE